MLTTTILSEVQDYAISLMEKHDLTGRGWRFTFDNAKSRFGSCRVHNKTISLSSPLTLLNWEQKRDKVIDTILHEIAHSLVYIRFHYIDKWGNPLPSHGAEWKAICVEIGARPERCFSTSEAEIVKGKFIYKCPNCGREVHYHKLKKRTFACGECCRKYNNSRFSPTYIMARAD